MRVRAAVGARVRHLLRTRRRRYFASFLLQAALAPFFIHDWDGFVFLRTVTDFLGGVTPYEVAEASPPHIYLNEQWPTPNSWYAYPPLPLFLMLPLVAIAHAAGIASPLLLRLALKIPLILGNLLLARVAHDLVRALGKDAERARWAEAAVLFNPFLIFIAAVWGMFDAWMMALLLASVVLLVRGHPRAAGIAFGASALVKIFPLFVSPVFFLWALRREPDKRNVARFVLSAVLTFAAVCVPFLMTAPHGFLEQTLLMHLERPLQGFTVLGVLYLGEFTSARFGFPLWPAPPAGVGPALATALLVPALLLAFAYAALRKPTPRHLVHATLVTVLLVLLTSKVVNEQYFVMPVALLTVLAATDPDSRRMLRAWTWGGLAAGLLLGWHWLTFIPPDVAPHLLGMSVGDAIHGLGVAAEWGLGVPPDVFYVLPDVLSALALLPAFLLALRACARALGPTLQRLRDLATAGAPAPQRALALGTLILLLAGPAALTAANALVTDAPGPEPLPELPERRVGVTYYVWWNDPNRDPAVPSGNWERFTLTPEQGFFTANGYQMAQDAAAMKEAGFDFAAVSYHGYDHGRYRGFLDVARAHGLRVAPLVEVPEIIGFQRYATESSDPRAATLLKPTDDALNAVANLVRRALEAPDHEALLREDGKPVVFLHGAHLVGPSWDAASKRVLADEILIRYGRDFTTVSRAWGEPIGSLDEMVARFPVNVTEYEAANPVSRDWRWAVDHRADVLVQRIRNTVGVPVHLTGTENPWFHEMANEAPTWSRHTLDGGFQYAAAPAYLRDPLTGNTTAHIAAFERQARHLAIKHGEHAVATVHYAYNDTALRPPPVGLTLRPDAPELAQDIPGALWDLARAQGARTVLVASWNNFFDGTAIQPSVEHGDEALERTREEMWHFREADPLEPSRVLVLVNERGTLASTNDKKDWTYSLGLQLPWRLHEAGVEVHVTELHAPLPKLTGYDAVWLEVGSGGLLQPLNETADALRAYAADGGNLVVLGGVVPEPFATLLGARELSPLGFDPVNVTWGGGEATYPGTSRHTRVIVSDGCPVLARFDATGTPAAWVCPVGEGHVVGTAFRPQGWDYREPPGSGGALRLLLDAAGVN